MLWNSSRLGLRAEEAEAVDLQTGELPAPLPARMRDASGVELVLAGASLEGVGEEQRAIAASALNEFAAEESEPVVLLADLDRGIALDGTNRDGSLGLLTEANRFEWTRPKPSQRTDCHFSHPAGLRELLLTAGSAQDWEGAPPPAGRGLTEKEQVRRHIAFLARELEALKARVEQLH
jgi:hypothetical protein